MDIPLTERTYFDFSISSLFIGLFLGMLIMLILVWFAYFGRVFLFSTCPIQIPYCVQNDYINNPGSAITQGYQADDILFINASVTPNTLLYKRPKSNNNCSPQSNQSVVIKYPQYCQMTNNVGATSIWKQTEIDSNIYRLANAPSDSITTDGNCVPVEDNPVNLVSGVPLPRWDPAPINSCT